MNITLQKKKFWHVAARTDCEELFPGRNRMIQAMKDLLPIVRPYIKKAELQKFTRGRLERTFPAFIQILFGSLRTPVSGFEIKYDGKYYIDIWCYHNIYDETAYVMSLSFLVPLKKSNKKLHGMIITTLKYLVQSKQVHCMEDDQWSDYPRECVAEDLEYNKKEYEKHDIARIQKELDDYDEFMGKYYDEIGREKYNVPRLRTMIENYKVSCHAESVILKWIDLVLEACKEPNTMNFFTNEALDMYCKECDIEKDEDGHYNFPDGNPVTPDEVMCFNWFRNKIAQSNHNSWLGDRAGNFGEASFSKAYTCRTGKQLKEARREFLKDVGYFPEKLAAALQFGAANEDLFYEYSMGYLTQILFTSDELRKTRLRSGQGTKSL